FNTDLTQFCFNFFLVSIASLLIQSLKRIQNSSPGFSTQVLILSSIDLFSAGYIPERARIFDDELLNRVRALPGVESATFSGVRPFSYVDYGFAPITIDGYQPAPDEQPTAEYNKVGEGYFTTIGIPLIAGRDFTRADDENAP